MTKEEINKTIISLQTDEEIIDFVKKRIQELESKSIETTVGQNYTTTFKEYISEKTHYKAAEKSKGAECPDLVYDDITPYISLVKSIKQSSGYNELTLFSTIFFEVYDYLPSYGDDYDRFSTYFQNGEKRISIKQIRKSGCAFCSEKSGMAHNMFKFLGVDCEAVCGYRDSQRHAYNIVYPNGYDNEPMIIYDPSFFVSFVKDGKKLSSGYFKVLGREEYEKLISGYPIKLELSRTEKIYRKLYGFGDEYDFVGDTPSYIAGLDRKKVLPSENITDNLPSTYLENGVESVSHKL